MNKYKIIVFSLSVVILMSQGCSSYEKLLKSSDVDLKYKKAFEYYNKKDYIRAATLFEQISNFYRGTTLGDSVMFFYAKSYYGQKDYLSASAYFQTFAETYPKSSLTEEARYLEAYCYFKMAPRPSLDQENTEIAIQKIQLFMLDYPKGTYIPECKRILQELKLTLMEKSYKNARLYYDLGNYKAATIALRNSLNEYPDTEYREEMMFLILKSDFLFAEKSVIEKRKERFQDTMDEYYAFIAEFPTSKYAKEADRIYNNSKKIIGEQSK